MTPPAPHVYREMPRGMRDMSLEESSHPLDFRTNLRRRHNKARLMHGLFFVATYIAVILLVVLLAAVIQQGIGWLNWDFLTSFPSRVASRAGINAALWGSIWLIVMTMLISVPFGIGAAIYLEEYTRKSHFTRLIEVNIANLAGVPSIVYGILGLAFFVRGVGLGRSVLAGALTMSLLVLPVIIIAAREALRSVPQSIRHAAFALGATRWQTVRAQVLPAAMPGILTGIILALSRALGETAPLVVMGALTYVAFAPSGPMDAFTVLPIQIFNWASRPQTDFHGIAAAGILVLLIVLLSMNGIAIWLRQRLERRVRW